ncbi:NAD-dependent epimerase/dehydratase family protein [Agromyces soli]
MRILLTGATGTIGSAVLDELLDAGHEVVAVVRSDRSAERVAARGASALRGELRNPAWLTAQLADVDAAIHAAAPEADAAGFDTAVVDAVEAAFAHDGRRFVHTGGIWTYGSSEQIDEDSPLSPPAIVAWREPIERRLLGSAVSATVIVPGVVYGYDRGIPALVVAPDEGGVRRLVGDGSQHWSLVHVDDLARLYRLAVEHERGLGRLIAVDGSPVGMRTLVEAALAADGGAGTVVEETPDASRARLGAAFADALLLDQRASGAAARRLGWTPTHRSVLDEYATEPAPAIDGTAA